MNRFLLSLLYPVTSWCLLLTGSSCRHSLPKTSSSATGNDVTITIDPAKTYQTIEHFGASDAWSCQFVGGWPETKKNAIADLLFSQDTLAGGQPKGIGLSMWRFNIGAGTAEQGTASGIGDEWRRAESFLNNDGTYNWDKQAGQVWFLKAAQVRGVPNFLAFPNSPPVPYTSNGKGFASNKLPNLNPDKFDQYGRFMAYVVAGIRTRTGITFNYISPVNEPQWDWSDGGQEGTPFYNNQIAGITRSLSKALVASQLPTQISVAEAGQIDFLFGEQGRPGKGNQINAFFDKTSADYLGDLPNLTRAIAYHSYFTTSPYAQAVQKRQQTAALAADRGKLGTWMSEYCILGDNAGEINGSGRDLGIGPALYIASVMHNDLVNAGASAWHWWLAISPYNYKDGLIYIDKNKTDGTYQASKMLWAMGNFSRFIRPAAVRIEAIVDATSSALLVSSYKNTNGQLVTVIINNSDTPQTVRLVSTSGRLVTVQGYRTSANANLTPLTGSLTQLDAQSITTLVSDWVR